MGEHVVDLDNYHIVDFDDYCDNVVGTLSIIEELRCTYPDFKVTLFAIPMRCSPDTIKAAQALDTKYGGKWLDLAPHGWRHTRGECLAWTSDEASDKIERAANIGIDAPVFKAPGWLLDDEVRAACHKINYLIYEHDHLASVGGIVHGHLTNCVCDNYIKDMLQDGRLTFRPGIPFMSVKDAINACS